MEEVLKWFNYPAIRAHSRCKVFRQGVPNQLASLLDSLCPCFVEASLTVEKVVMCYKEYRLVASFHSIQSLLAVCKFGAAGKECCKRGRRQVCVNLMPWCPK